MLRGLLRAVYETCSESSRLQPLVRDFESLLLAFVAGQNWQSCISVVSKVFGACSLPAGSATCTP
jgi:hypothetical protein